MFICVLVGFLGGLCELPLAEKDGRPWPVQQMRDRGDLQGFYQGIAIAIPSGFGVALSVLGDNTACLVGVAISASLLPPATNCGMLLAYATLNSQYPVQPGSERVAYTSLELVEMSAWSLMLTTGNIICIWIAGVIMFRIKEVSPIPEKSEFWDVHVGNVRKYNMALNKEQGEELAKRFKHAMKLVGHRSEHNMQTVSLNTLSASRTVSNRNVFRSILNPDLFMDPSILEEEKTPPRRTKSGRKRRQARAKTASVEASNAEESTRGLHRRSQTHASPRAPDSIPQSDKQRSASVTRPESFEVC